MKDEDFIGARPPYGYKKAPDNCHKLFVNEDTAPIVRQIFEWTAHRAGLNEIVRQLNEEGILTPGYYLASVGIIKNQRLMGSGKLQSWLHAVLAAQTTQMRMGSEAKSARKKLAQDIAGAGDLTSGLVDTLIDWVYIYLGSQVEIIWKIKDFCTEEV